MTISWTIDGADGQPIIGETHVPDAPSRGNIVIAHGFKGYKDYGMFPRIAAELSGAGFSAHRFNFSYSGMTNRIETFERPDLFERDTWNKQVFDLRTLIEAKCDPALPYVVFGHSRGGVAALLTAARFANDAAFPKPAGMITAAAPASCNSLSREDAAALFEEGFLFSPSSRTGQQLRIGRAFVQEQHDDPANHDLLALIARIRCPILIIHGDHDPTVHVSAAHQIASAASAPAQVEIIPGADHVFNTPNPFPERDANGAAPPGPQLARLLGIAIEFCQRVCGRS